MRFDVEARPHWAKALPQKVTVGQANILFSGASELRGKRLPVFLPSARPVQQVLLLRDLNVLWVDTGDAQWLFLKCRGGVAPIFPAAGASAEQRACRRLSDDGRIEMGPTGGAHHAGRGSKRRPRDWPLASNADA